MKKLAEVSALQNPELIVSGIVKEGNVLDAPLWADGLNVEFREGEVQKSREAELIRVVPSSIIGLAQANVSGIARIYLATEDSFWKYSNETLTDIGSTVNSKKCQIIPWGAWAIFNDGKAAPKVWKNSAALAVTLGGITFSTAKVLHKWGPYIFAFNTSNGDNWVEWCSADAVEDWTPTSVNSARNLVLRDLDSGVQSAAALGDTIAVYSNHTMLLGNFLGGDYVFGFKPALKGIGAVSREAVVSTGRENYGISTEGLWRTDGVSFEYIDGYDISKWIRKHVNFSAAEQIRSCVLKDQIRFALPIDGSETCNIVFGYNYNSKAVSYYDVVPTAMAPKEVFEYPIFGLGGNLCFGDKVFDTNSGFVQTKPLDFGERQLMKRIQQLILTKEGNFDFDIGLQVHLDDPIEWLGAQSAATVNDILDREGAYISLKFSGASEWSISGATILGEATGYVV